MIRTNQNVCLAFWNGEIAFVACLIKISLNVLSFTTTNNSVGHRDNVKMLIAIAFFCWFATVKFINRINSCIKSCNA